MWPQVFNRMIVIIVSRNFKYHNPEKSMVIVLGTEGVTMLRVDRFA